MVSRYTTEQLADLWEDVHAIESMMGRRAFHILLRQDMKTWREFWCKKAPNPCLGTAVGYYVGYEALAAWFQAGEKLTTLKSSLVKKKYPDELGGKADAEIFGAGSLDLNSPSTHLVPLRRFRQ